MLYTMWSTQESYEDGRAMERFPAWSRDHVPALYLVVHSQATETTSILGIVFPATWTLSSASKLRYDEHDEHDASASSARLYKEIIV